MKRMPSITTSIVIIPGKNWRLSLIELISFLESKQVRVVVNDYSKAFFALWVKDPSVIDISALGGTIKVGRVEWEFDSQIVKDAFIDEDKRKEMQIKKYFGQIGSIKRMFEKKSGEKPIFGVSVYWTDSVFQSVSRRLQRFIGSTTKRLLASQGKKANFMGFAKDRSCPQLTHVEVLKKRLVEKNAEILFCVGKEKSFVAITTAVHNPFEFQKRDLEKPGQRRIFGMPPRLARIMINMALKRENQVLLDPFCGVGTILQEALLLGAKTIGMDINRWCVEAATRNLKWLRDEYSLKNAEYRVLQGDVSKLAEKIGIAQVDCIVTEPDLGPALRQVPTRPYALKIIKKLLPLYHIFLKESYEVLREEGRIVMVSPYIKTRSGQPVTMGIGENAAQIGFKTLSLFREDFFANDSAANEKLIEMTSFIETDKRHKIGREISILQKVRNT